MDLEERSVEYLATQHVESIPQFRGYMDQVSFHRTGNILVITGRVPSFYLKQILQKSLEGLDGIERVDNQVDVVSPEGLSSIRTDAANG